MPRVDRPPRRRLHPLALSFPSKAPAEWVLPDHAVVPDLQIGDPRPSQQSKIRAMVYFVLMRDFHGKPKRFGW